MNFQDIKVYKNIFSSEDCETIKYYLDQPKWKYGHRSTNNSVKSFWSMSLDDNEYFFNYLFGKILNIVNQKFSIEKVYANGQTFGLDGEFHTDCHLLDTTRYTFLYYCNEVWDKSWLGDTLFQDEYNNLKHFYPEPNSAIFFPGNIFHYGQSPSRDYYGLRTTLAFKMIKE